MAFPTACTISSGYGVYGLPTRSFAALNWSDHNFYVVGNNVLVAPVDTSTPSSPQLKAFTKRYALPGYAQNAHWPAFNTLGGNPVLAFLTFTYPNTYTSFQVLRILKGEGSDFSFAQDLITIPLDLSYVTALLPPGVPLVLNGFASAVGPALAGGGETIYYFVAVQGLPGFFYFTSDGVTASALRPLPEPVGSAPAGYNFVHLSAAPVTLGPHGAGAVVAGLTIDSTGTLQVQAFAFSLSELAAGGGSPVYMQRFAPQSVSGSTRLSLDISCTTSVCWGPSYTDSGMMQGSIATLFLHVPFVGVYYLQLDLLTPSRSESTFSFGAKPGNTAYFSAFPVSVNGKIQTTNKSIGVDGGQFISCFTYLSDDTHKAYVVYDWFLPSLLYSPSEVKDYVAVPPPGADLQTQRAYVATWTLVGVITGVPPFKDGSFLSGYPGVVFATKNQQTRKNSVSSQRTALVGGSAGGISAQADWAWTAQTATVSEYTLNFGEPLSPPEITGSLASWWNRVGYLVVVVPTYTRATYKVYNWDGKDTGGSMVLMWPISGDARIYYFDLTNPNQLSDLTNGPSGLYSFPVDGSNRPLAVWPTLDSFNEWARDPTRDPKLAPKGSMVDLLTGLNLTAIAAGTSNAFEESVDMSQQKSQTTTTEHTISVDAEVELFGIKFKAGFGIKRSQEVETSYADSVTLSFSYPKLRSDGPVKSVCIKPYLLKPNDANTNLPWVPTPLAGQRPWILTWRYEGE